MNAQTNELPISISLVLVMDSGLAAITEPKPAKLYDEVPGLGYDRCIEMPDLKDPANVRVPPNGPFKLRDWVLKNSTFVIIHCDDPTPLALGKSGIVGLTSEEIETDTKKHRVMVDTSLAQLTIEDLRKRGIIP